MMATTISPPCLPSFRKARSLTEPFIHSGFEVMGGKHIRTQSQSCEAIHGIVNHSNICTIRRRSYRFRAKNPRLDRDSREAESVQYPTEGFVEPFGFTVLTLRGPYICLALIRD